MAIGLGGGCCVGGGYATDPICRCWLETVFKAADMAILYLCCEMRRGIDRRRGACGLDARGMSFRGGGYCYGYVHIADKCYMPLRLLAEPF